MDLMKHVYDTFNIRFKNEKLLKIAFTHSSYANDHRNEEIEHLERLEFLGDAVIELIVSDYYLKNTANYPKDN